MIIETKELLTKVAVERKLSIYDIKGTGVDRICPYCMVMYGFGGKKENQIEDRHINAGARVRAEYLERKSQLAARRSGRIG